MSENDLIRATIEHTKQEGRRKGREALMRMRKVILNHMAENDMEIPESFKTGAFLEWFLTEVNA